MSARVSALGRKAEAAPAPASVGPRAGDVPSKAPTGVSFVPVTLALAFLPARSRVLLLFVHRDPARARGGSQFRY